MDSGGGEVVILASKKFHSIRVYDNLVYYPSNELSILANVYVILYYVMWTDNRTTVHANHNQ